MNIFIPNKLYLLTVLGVTEDTGLFLLYPLNRFQSLIILNHPNSSHLICLDVQLILVHLLVVINEGWKCKRWYCQKPKCTQIKENCNTFSDDYKRSE